MIFKIGTDDNSLMNGTQPDFRSSANGLKLPFALASDGSIIELIIDDQSSCGIITGRPGSGKSTLLHTLIASSVSHYGPSELELWLIDYTGVEFATYTTPYSPHIKYVFTGSDDETSYTILRQLNAEIEHRIAMLTAAGAKNYIDYRALDKKNTLPRLLILIDSFCGMAWAIEKNSDYRYILANALAMAPSLGISIFFSEQKLLPLLHSLSYRSPQLFTNRIALKHTVEDIQETLALKDYPIDKQTEQMILDLSLSRCGGAIYRCGSALHECQIISLSPSQCETIIRNASNHYNMMQ